MDAVSQREPSRRERLLALIVFVVVLVSSLLTLTRFPEPHTDEANRGSIAVSFYESGQFTTDLRGDLLGFDEATAGAGRLHAVGLGAAFRVLGIRLVAARLVSMVGWLLAVVMTFLVGQSLFDSRAGLISALVFALTARSFIASHYARPDIWTAATTLCVIYYYLHARRNPTPARYFALGILMLWPVEQHFVAAWLLVPIAGLVVAENIRTGRGRLQIGAYVAGSVIAVAAVWALQFLPDPVHAMHQLRPGNTAYGDLYSGGVIDRVVWSVAMFISGSLMPYRSSTLVYIMLPGMILYTLYALFGLSSAMIRRSDADKRLVALWGIALLAFTFGMAHKNMSYAVIFDPYFALFIGAALSGAGGLREKLPALRNASLSAMIAPLVIVSVICRLVFTSLVWPYDNATYQDRLADKVPPDVHLMAPAPLWYTFHETNDFTADWYFATWACNRETPLAQEDMAGLMGDLEIDYVIDQGWLDTLFDCPNLLPPDASAMYEALLEESCAVVDEIDKPTFPGGGYSVDSPVTVIYDCRGAFSDQP
ncbi:MAG: glycosyltransferase family 39 protein [Anaerolineae bacterium]|nr:glycosyltransferase family 39 protein [Anaerolineae bacterium]